MLISSGSANYRQQVAHLTMRLRIATGVWVIENSERARVCLHMCVRFGRRINFS